MLAIISWLKFIKVESKSKTKQNKTGQTNKQTSKNPSSVRYIHPEGHKYVISGQTYSAEECMLKWGCNCHWQLWPWKCKLAMRTRGKWVFPLHAENIWPS